MPCFSDGGCGGGTPHPTLAGGEGHLLPQGEKGELLDRFFIALVQCFICFCALNTIPRLRIGSKVDLGDCERVWDHGRSTASSNSAGGEH